MKHQISTLEGAELDAAVATAYGARSTIKDFVDGPTPRCILRDRCLEFEAGTPFAPSSRWSYGGPIIEREEISVIRAADDRYWRACAAFYFEGGITGPDGFGPTPLIAAMRAFVESKLGGEVELL